MANKPKKKAAKKTAKKTAKGRTSGGISIQGPFRSVTREEVDRKAADFDWQQKLAGPNKSSLAQKKLVGEHIRHNPGMTPKQRESLINSFMGLKLRRKKKKK